MKNTTLKESSNQWKFTFNTPIGKKKLLLKDPLGYGKQIPEVEVTTSKKNKELIQDLLVKKAWETAKQPSKSIFVTALMMYMSGKQINIFSIMIVFYTIFNSLKSIMGVNGAFSHVKALNQGLLKAKLLNIFFHLVTFSICLYKLHIMGLLPTRADRLATVVFPTVEQLSYGGLGFE